MKLVSFFKSQRTLFLLLFTAHAFAQNCGSLDFNVGTNTSVKLPLSNQYYTAVNGGYTWECWFKLNQLPGGTNDLPLISAIDGVAYEDMMLGFGWHGGVQNQPVSKLIFKVDPPNTTPPSAPSCNYMPPGGFLTNMWYHAAGVMNYVTQSSFLYLNGQLVDVKPVEVASNTRVIETRLGECAACGLNNVLDGNLDEVRIWNRPLTSQEIQTNYDRCLSANQPNLLVYYHCNQTAALTVTDATTNGNTGTFISQQGWSSLQAPIYTGTTCPSCAGLAVYNPVMCAGDGYVIMVSNTSSLTNPSYSVQPGGMSNNTGTFAVLPLISTNYTTYVTGTNSLNATVTQSAITGVTVYPQPLTNVTTTQTSCISTLNAFNLGLTFNPPSPAPSYTVTWLTNTPNGINSVTQTSLVGGITTNTYYAIVTAQGGCSVYDAVIIDPPPPIPTFTITNLSSSTTLTCLYPTVTLGAVSTYSYHNDPLNYYWSSPSFTASSQPVTIVNPGTYSVIASDPVTSCSVVHTIAISINTAVPVSSVAPVSQIVGCGPGVVATATGIVTSPTANITQSWYFPGSPVPYVTVGPISIVSPIVGTNTYVVTDAINGCSITKTLEVISNGGTYPTFDLASVTQFTLGCGTRSLSNIIINNGQVPPNGGAVSYTVLTPAFTGTNYGFGSNITYTLNSPGIYTVIVKSNNNACETRVPVSIIQNTFAPNVGVSIPTQTLDCNTTSVTLLGTSTSTDVIDYLWKFNGNPPSSVGYSITVHTTTAGASVASGTVIDNYTLVVTNENNTCTNSTVVPMYQNTRPPIAIIAGSGSLTCLIDSVTLSNVSLSGILPNTFPTPDAIIGFSWYGPTPQQPKSNASTYTGYVPGTYTLSVKDLNNGCTSQTTALIADGRVYPVLSTNTLVVLDCGSSVSGGVKLPVTVIGLPAGAVTAQWNVPVPSPNVSGLNTLILTTNGPGSYTLAVTTISNSCTSSIQINVENGILNGDFTADQQTGFAPLTVHFTNNSASTSSVSGTASITSIWSFGNGTMQTTTASIGTSAMYTQPGTYTVTLFVSKGSCLDTVVKVIHVDIPSGLEAPNVFTPNGDNSNDVFFLSTANLTNITAFIFDRWGDKVYEISTDKGNIAWDGKNQAGREVAAGTFFYFIKATGKDGQSYDVKGTVSLYR